MMIGLFSINLTVNTTLTRVTSIAAEFMCWFVFKEGEPLYGL